MADDSQKILKELSSLSSNLDVLSRELRQNNKLLSDQKQVQTKILEDKADEKTEEKGDSKQPFDQKFFENFAKSLADNFQKDQGNLTSSITQTLGKELSGILQKKENKPAQIKPLPAGDKENNPINFLLNSLKSLPKMQDGGKVTSSGTAIVGEKGPEVVNLVQGSKVSPTSNSGSFVNQGNKKSGEELGKLLSSPVDGSMTKKIDYALENKIQPTGKKEITKNGSTVAQTSLSSIESSIQKNGPPPIKDVEKFENFKNVWGIKVPMDVLNSYRYRLYHEDPDFYSQYDDGSDLDSDTLRHFKYSTDYPEYLPNSMEPGQIDETLKKGIEDDPELMTPQDVAKLAIPVKTPPPASNVDMQSPSSSSSKKKEKKGAKETVEGELERKRREGKKLSETKFGKTVTNSAKLIGEVGKEVGKNFINNKIESFTGVSPTFLKERIKEFQERQKGTSEISNEQQQLKVMEKPRVENKGAQPNPVPQPVEKRQETTPAQTETKTPTTSIQSPQTQSQPKINGGQEPMDLTKDMKELKGLLAGIYKSLQSHLDISANSPYRPNSNII